MIVEDDPVHAWFSLTYANYLVWPRAVMQSMPVEWQRRFVELANELEATMGGWLMNDYRVQRVVDGRFAKDDVPHYNRGRTVLPPRPYGADAPSIATSGCPAETRRDAK